MPRAVVLVQASLHQIMNILRLRQNGRHFAEDIFVRIFLNENVRISIEISLNLVSKGPINNKPALVQIIAWSQIGEKTLSEPSRNCGSVICYDIPTLDQYLYIKSWKIQHFIHNYENLQTQGANDILEGNVHMKLKFQCKLKLCFRYHAIYRQTDKQTDGGWMDMVNSVCPKPTLLQRGILMV